MSTRQSYGSGSICKRAPHVWRLRVMVDGKQVQGHSGSRGGSTQGTPQVGIPGASAGGARSSCADGGRLAHRMARVPADPRRLPKTVAEYERKVKTRIRPKFGDVPLADLTAHDLDRAYAGWQAEGLSALSVHHHHAILSAALTQGVKWNWIPDSPARKASPPSPASTRKLVTPNREQVGLLISPPK